MGIIHSILRSKQFSNIFSTAAKTFWRNRTCSIASPASLPFSLRRLEVLHKTQDDLEVQVWMHNINESKEEEEVAQRRNQKQPLRCSGAPAGCPSDSHAEGERATHPHYTCLCTHREQEVRRSRVEYGKNTKSSVTSPHVAVIRHVSKKPNSGAHFLTTLP